MEQYLQQTDDFLAKFMLLLEALQEILLQIH